MNLSVQGNVRQRLALRGMPRLVLLGISRANRRKVLPVLTEAMASNGCWLEERRALSFSQVEFLFEMQMRAVVDVYSALIGAGLELTRASHAELTGLMMLRRHSSPRGAGLVGLSRTVRVRLEVRFLEEGAEMGWGIQE